MIPRLIARLLANDHLIYRSNGHWCYIGHLLTLDCILRYLSAKHFLCWCSGDTSASDIQIRDSESRCDKSEEKSQEKSRVGRTRVITFNLIQVIYRNPWGHEGFGSLDIGGRGFSRSKRHFANCLRLLRGRGVMIEWNTWPNRPPFLWHSILLVSWWRRFLSPAMTISR